MFWREQCSRNEIKNRCPPFGNPLRRQRVEADDLLDHRRASEIKNDHGHHGRHEVLRLHRSELALRDAFLQYLVDAEKDGLDIGLDQLVDVLRFAFTCPHHLALHQPWIELIGGDEVETSSRIREDLFPRWKGAVEYFEDRVFESRKSIVEHGAVKRVFV